MLTPQEISKTEFVKAVFGGYDMSAVDDFLEKLTADYAALYKENAILKSKIKVLVEKIEEYRSTEDSMRMALLTAQKMSDDLVNEAKTKSANILAAAEKQAKSQKEEINRGVADEGARLQAAKEATAAFVSQSKEMIKKHLEFLASLKEIQAPEIPAAEPQPAADAEEEKEDKIMDAAMAIDSAVSKMYEDDDTPASPNSASAEDADASAPTRTFRTKKKGEIDWEDEGEPTSPRPKFNFDDLKFGSNYDED